MTGAIEVPQAGSMKQSARFSVFVVLVWGGITPLAMAEEGSRHPHHVAVAAGAAWHGSESSAYLGIDYAYTFKNGISAAVFVEQVRGDFDLAAYGFAVGRFFENGWKVSTGPGVETKLKNNKTLFLWHFNVGYDWRFGNWSVGPIASFDYIEDASNTTYLGISLGYGF